MAGRRGYERYLLDNERVVVALHRHWGMVAGPVTGCVAGLVVAVWVDVVAPDGAQPVATAVWWAWFALLAWMAWQLVQWRGEWFIATDKRLVLTQGLLTKNVAMMPLTKVTDLSYVRTLLGRVVGYGEFVLESAGQDQALREVSWIPRPDATYRAICAEIFGSPDDDAPPAQLDGHDDPDGYDDDGDGGGDGDLWGPAWPAEEPGEDPPTGDHSRAIPVRPSSWPSQPSGEEGPGERWDRDDGESLYASDDIERRQRAADTGPIHRYDV